MLRTFDQHEVRPEVSLCGWWEFALEEDHKGPAPLPGAYPRTLHVPSAWEQLPGLECYRGKAWLRAIIEGDPDRAVRLVFGGVSHTADVFLDGRHVGHHYDAFTPFAVVAGPLDEGPHDLVVAVDNRFGDASALHRPNDYYTYGGITRPAVLQYVPEVYIDHVFATPARRGKKWSLDLRVRLRNWAGEALTRSAVVSLGDQYVELGEVTVPAGGTVEVPGRMTGLDVEPWSPVSPTLYGLQALLVDGGEIVDDLIDRIGFRDVKVRGKKLLLNGKPLRLRGYNRHEDHGQFGCAIPLEAMVLDLALLRDLGCNFVRTCHYPNDMRFLDLCDEMGFCVWEESHARAVPFDAPKFREQIAASTTEMIEWHGNRPSIVIWGCLNECDSVSPAGREEHARVIELIKRLDRSRPVTFASNKAERDACLDLVDIVSWNRYAGWYHDRPADVGEDLQRLLKWLHSPASGGKGKPVILSEFGAGAIPGYRHPSHVKWTEEYQAEALDAQLAVYLHHPDVVGCAIWQFCDTRITTEETRFNSRPRTMNNKGTVDELRRPKLAYETVRRRMREAAT